MIKLRELFQYSGFRALAWHANELYASKGYRIYKWNSENILESFALSKSVPKPTYVGFYNPDILRRLATKNRYSNRLTRSGFHSLSFLGDGRMIGVIAKNIIVLDSGETEFKSTWRMKRGNKPRGLSVTPDDRIFWGEYFRNPCRKPIHIYGSFDRGDSWHIVYTFPRTINHVHNVYYDHWDNYFWITTGDEGEEPKIMRASHDWSTVDVIHEGNQQVRVADMIITPDHILYATDTPHEQNRIYRMEKKTGNLNAIAKSSGPSMWCTKVNDTLFFSTASEPGRFYYPSACIWGTADGNLLEKVIEWPKDKWHPRFFQFGNVILPKGDNSKNILAATGVAVKKTDAKLFFWKIENS